MENDNQLLNGFDNYPDWDDNTMRVYALMKDGKTVNGILDIEDTFFTGDDEVPMFIIIGDDGNRYNFVDVDKWKRN